MQLQWGHDPGAVEEAPQRPHEAEPVDTSMGPRPGGRGRGGQGDAMRMADKLLQWGHDPGAVEEDFFRHRRGFVEPTSMGPRPGGRGRVPSWRVVIYRKDALQWGHDPGAVEEGDVGGVKAAGRET